MFHLTHDAEMPLGATLELHHFQGDPKQMEVSQLYGPDNADAPAAAMSAAEALAADYRAAAEATFGARRRSSFYTPKPLPDK